MAGERVDQAEVEEILHNPKGLALGPYITAAHQVVEALSGLSPLGEGGLKEVERWLAAHFASAGDERLRSWRILEIDDSRPSSRAGSGWAWT